MRPDEEKEHRDSCDRRFMDRQITDTYTVMTCECGAMTLRAVQNGSGHQAYADEPPHDNGQFQT